jgi:putative phage-type endonuclease
MKRLISTLNLSKEDWLRYRKCGITGTDAGAILGLNPYRSAFQVYHDKISDTIENIDNEAMRQGRDLEDYYAQLGECLRMLSLYFCRAVRVAWRIMWRSASPKQPV